MHIESLSITGFRNLLTDQISFSPGINILFGANGTGKTNILEAIFTLCLGRSQRGAGDSVLLHKEKDVYRLEGRVAIDKSTHKVAVAYQRGGRKKVVIDEVVSKTKELYNHFCVVSAGPEDSDILTGPPSVRRNFLDIYLSQLAQTYMSNLTDYQRSLAQKNAALKAGMDPSPFEPLLISSGALVTSARSSFLNSLGVIVGKYHREISRDEPLSVAYCPSVGVTENHGSLEDIETAFKIRIEDNFERERVLQNSVVGPHRDEVQFEIGGLPARSHASQGQLRTAAVSLKLAIYHLLKEKRRMSPVILLDEIFAELDEHRTRGLIDLFGDFSQLFLTTANEAPVTLRDSGCCYRVVNGQVEVIA
jgi:DNA replication and repair protein RecF